MIAQANARMRDLGIDGSKQNESRNFNFPVVLLESVPQERICAGSCSHLFRMASSAVSWEKLERGDTQVGGVHREKGRHV